MAIGAYAVPITVNNASVAESSTNFTYLYDLSAKLASDTIFKSHITTAANIAVWSVEENAKKPRRVVLDLSNNILILYWDGSISTAATKTFWVCVGAGINEVDSTSVFTNNGICNFWGFDELVDGSTSVDFAGGNTLTEGSGFQLGTTGKIGKCATASGGTSTFDGGTISDLTSAQRFSLTLDLFYTLNFTGSQVVAYFNGTAGEGVWFYQLLNTIRLYIGVTNYAYFDNSGWSLNTWYRLLWVYDGTLAEADRIKLYVNGVAVTTAVSGTIPTTTTSSTGATRFGHPAANAFRGNYDNVAIHTVARTSEYASTVYNMIYVPETFYSTGTGFSLGRPATLWNKVKMRLRAGFK